MLRSIAYVISVVFHPLLMLTYMLVLLLLINPYLFGVSDISEPSSKLLILRIFLSSFFIPFFSISMLRFLGMIESMEMKDKQERIGPYIITGLFYTWIFWNSFNSQQIPDAYAVFVLGSVIGLFLAFLINIFTKISAHAVGMGGLVGMVLITMFMFSYVTDSFAINFGPLGVLQLNMTMLFMIVLILAGLVGTSRLILQAHEPADLYGGYLVGLFSQIIALRFLF